MFSELFFLLPLISIILWIFIFFKWTNKFLSKENTWYIFFRFLFVFVILNFVTFLLYWLIAFFKVSDMSNINDISNINALWLSMIIWLPILWSSIWIWFLWKYLYNFIQKFTINWWIILKLLFFILSLFFIISISYWTVLWLMIFFKHINDLFFWSWIIFWNAFWIWLSWLWMWIWFWLMISWLLIYIEKLFSNEWLTIFKKIKYIILNMLFCIVLYNLITFWIIYSLMVSFQLFELQNLNFYQYINSGLILWILWMLATTWQWYLFFNYHNKSWKLLFPILSFILLNVLLFSWLAIVFNIINW